MRHIFTLISTMSDHWKALELCICKIIPFRNGLNHCHQLNIKSDYISISTNSVLWNSWKKLFLHWPHFYGLYISKSVSAFSLTTAPLLLNPCQSPTLPWWGHSERFKVYYLYLYRLECFASMRWKKNILIAQTRSRSRCTLKKFFFLILQRQSKGCFCLPKSVWLGLNCFCSCGGSVVFHNIITQRNKR